MISYDVIVVGGGHAGTEAAAAAARIGVRTLLVTMRRDQIGTLSCNPAVGGVGKGHLVREIDALDGLIGRAADMAGLQFRVLNGSKGPAVRGPRAQVDRQLYRRAMQQLIAGQPNLDVREGMVDALSVEGNRCTGVVLADGTTCQAQTVVLTTGTFLRGIIHHGREQTDGGRLGDPPSVRLADQLRDLDLPIGRLKTGTPPRLDGRTIDWERTETQHGDARPTPLSFLTSSIDRTQLTCGITHTDASTHAVIADNLHQSAVYGGALAGRGPRYCPSIEDKIVRFADRDSHQVFLEPEGYDDHTVYPNGISTSLPPHVQEAFVRTVPALERVVILSPGYAIEYDYVDPRSLRDTLELRALPGLFLAGQINGTTGYEEAAAQGLLAGANAAAQVREVGLVRFARHEAYIGVLVDDLTRQGVTEPYRMFTSRAEHRLSLRADNADGRLTGRGIDVGLVASERARAFHVKQERLEEARTWFTERRLTPNSASEAGIAVNADGRRRSLAELLAMPGVTFDQLAVTWPPAEPLRRDIVPTLEADAAYAGYLERQQEEAALLSRYETATIPQSMDYASLPGLSNELLEKLSTSRPETLAQARRIEGMTPTALSLLVMAIRKREAADVGA